MAIPSFKYEPMRIVYPAQIISQPFWPCGPTFSNNILQLYFHNDSNAHLGISFDGSTFAFILHPQVTFSFNLTATNFFVLAGTQICCGTDKAFGDPPSLQDGPLYISAFYSA